MYVEYLALSAIVARGRAQISPLARIRASHASPRPMRPAPLSSMKGRQLSATCCAGPEEYRANGEALSSRGFRGARKKKKEKKKESVSYTAGAGSRVLPRFCCTYRAITVHSHPFVVHLSELVGTALRPDSLFALSMSARAVPTCSDLSCRSMHGAGLR